MNAATLIEPKLNSTITAQAEMKESSICDASVAAHDRLQQLEITLARRNKLELQLLKQLHPEWYALLDDTNLSTASGEEIEHLIHTAPNSFALGLVSGSVRVRLDIAAITGRCF